MSHSLLDDERDPTAGPHSPLLGTDDNGGTRRSEHGHLEDDVLIPEESPLGRNIDWKSAYIIAISRVIGSGIFAVPGLVVKSSGSIGLSLTLWVIGALIVAADLAVSLEYGCMLPRSGGDKVYLEFTYPRPRFLATTLVATQAVLLGFTASNCMIFSQYIFFAFDAEPTDFWRKTLAVMLLTVITMIHGVWYRVGIRIQNFLGWIKIGLIAFMALLALYVMIARPSNEDFGGEPKILRGPGVWDGLWQGSDWNFGTIITSLFKVCYSYSGITNLNNVLDEVKDPVRTLKSVSLSALLTTCFLYLLANLAYFAVVPVEEIKQSGQLIAALFFERVLGESLGRRFLPVAVALSAAGNVMVATFSLARLNQEIARAGFLPFSRYLSSLKPFNTPLGGLIVHYIPSMLVIILPPTNEVYSFILEVEGYPALFFALAISAGVIWLRYKRPDLKRPFKAWISAAVFRFLLCLAALTAPFFPPSNQKPGGLWYATYAVVGVGVIFFGVLYWLIWTIVLPRLGHYRLEEKNDILDDGTTVTVLTRVPKTE